MPHSDHEAPTPFDIKARIEERLSQLAADIGRPGGLPLDGFDVILRAEARLLKLWLMADVTVLLTPAQFTGAVNGNGGGDTPPDAA